MINIDKGKLTFITLVFLCLALYPLIAGSYGIDLVTKIMIYAILALSLELLVGTTGLICFGQAAFFGIGAYSTVLLSPEDGPAALWCILPASIAITALYALFVGALSLRTKGVYFIMVTLAFSQMAYFVVHDTDIGGGSDGIYLYFTPGLDTWLDLSNKYILYFFTLLFLIWTFVFLAILVRSHLGRALAGIRINEQRMLASGYTTYPYKLAAFVTSGGIAGLAGFLFAAQDGFVNPEMMSWHMSGALLVMIILGGLGHLNGAVIGAFAFVFLEEFFKSSDIFGAFASHWHLGFGLVIIASVAALPKGLVGIPELVQTRLMGYSPAKHHSLDENS